MRASILSVPVVLALLVAVTRATPAHAQWPTNPYSGNVLASTALGAESDPVAVSDGQGGCILVYASSSNAGDIHAQRISRTGLPLWGAGGVVVCSQASGQIDPRAVADGSGGVIIVWTDYRNLATSQEDLYAQRLNASGVPQWTANGVVVCNQLGGQFESLIVSDGAGGAIVGWSDLRTPGNSEDIYAQRLAANGTRLWSPDGVDVCTNSASQFELRMRSDDAGGALFVWTDFRSATSYDIYAQRVNSSGTELWTLNGRSICSSAGNQRFPDVLSDGAGGAFFVWADFRNTVDYDLYGNRLLSNGFSFWATNGIALCAQANDQSRPRMCSDGVGGFIVVFEDDRTTDGVDDLYAQRVGSGGSLIWNSAGVAVTTATGAQDPLVLHEDGAGGAVIAWRDRRSGTVDEAYAARLSGTGANQWTANGVLVSTGFGSRSGVQVVSDGDGGALIAWTDGRESNTTVRAQNVERYGQLGDPSPRITSAKDVANDQGGFIRLAWSRSHLDADPTFGIVEYRVFRSVPASALASSAARRTVTLDSDVAARDGALLVLPSATGNTAWEFVGSQSAEAFSVYSRVVATTSDSVGGSNPRTLFMVEARAGTSSSSDRWFSPPDSGYSVDNLAPAMPAPLTGFYLAGVTRLAWNPNTESDLAGYRLYRGSSAGFVPGPSNLVAALPDTGYQDPGGAPFVYKLTAVDVHGNESPIATLIPSGVLDAGPGVPALALAGAWPNPLRDMARVQYSLPASMEATVSVHDLAGREMARLAHGPHAAGPHSARWNGRGARGERLAAGMYFVRLAAAGHALTTRVVLAR